jgi:hypothetical protein
MNLAKFSIKIKIKNLNAIYKKTDCGVATKGFP